MADVHTRKAGVHLEDGQQGGQHLNPRRLQQVLYIHTPLVSANDDFSFVHHH